ncbi:MAG: hypothetical protein EBS98_08690 [Chitinophagia bacterium]|nr:hypothetical protein [Chitinophagia bacterium]
MSWSYRVTQEIRTHKYDVEPRVMYCIRSVYYDENNNISSIGGLPEVIGESISDLEKQLHQMLECCNLPLIDYNTGEELN